MNKCAYQNKTFSALLLFPFEFGQPLACVGVIATWPHLSLTWYVLGTWRCSCKQERKGYARYFSLPRCNVRDIDALSMRQGSPSEFSHFLHLLVTQRSGASPYVEARFADDSGLANFDWRLRMPQLSSHGASACSWSFRNSVNRLFTSPRSDSLWRRIMLELAVLTFGVTGWVSTPRQ